MTLERFEEILADTLDNGYVSILRANNTYHEEFPQEEYTLFRRENNRIRVGFSTVICPTIYLESYFNQVPARKEGIVYQTAGSFDSIMREHREFLEAHINDS